MITNVKPGDMARVLAPMPAAGAIVEVLRPTDSFSLWVVNPDPKWGKVYWDVKVVTGAPARSHGVVGPSQPCYLLPGGIALAPDRFLQRIDPEADPEAEPRIIETPVTEHA